MSGSFHTLVPAGSCRSELSAPGQAPQQVQAALSFYPHVRPGAALVTWEGRGGGRGGSGAGVNTGPSPAQVTQAGQSRSQEATFTPGCGAHLRVDNGPTALTPVATMPHCGTAFGFRTILEMLAVL